MGLSEKDVRYVAKLAKLAILPEEFDQIQRDLNRVLQYVNQLQELDTEAVEPTRHGLERPMAGREDRVVPPLAVERALQNAPQVRDMMFVVPRIVEGGES